MRKIMLFTLLALCGPLYSIPQGLSCSNPMNAVIGNNTANNTGGQDQWYVFEAPQDGRMILSTCGTTTANTYVEVYLSQCSSFASYYNDWGCDDQAKLIIPVTQGEKYYIRWAGIFTDETYTWTLAVEDPVPGEFCVYAKTAVADTNECDHTQNIDQWFVYNATADGYATISTCGLTSEDTYVSVFSDCLGSFIIESNDACDKQSQVKFAVEKNKNYYIKWYTYTTTGKYKWTLKEEPPLPGERCVTAINATVGTSNYADHSAGIDQWFKYKATKNGRITVNTCGLTTEHTYLILMSNCEFANFNYKTVACGTQTYIYFQGLKDETYYFRWRNAYTSGSYNWELKEEDPLPGEFYFNPITAHLDTNYADHTAGIDQWYTYTATKDGSLEISSCGLTTVNTLVSIYRADSPLSPFMSNNDACGQQSKLKVMCKKGETFLIHWYNFTSETYPWILKEEDPLPGEYYFTAINALKGTNTADHSQNIDQWFVYRPTKDCKLHVTSCGYTTERTELAVYDSTNFEYEKYYNSGACGNQSELYFQAEAGKSYYIRWNKQYTTGIYEFLIEELDVAEGEYCIKPKQAQIGNNVSDHTSGIDQWFSYTATKTGKIEISTCDLTTLSTNLNILKSCQSSYDPLDYYVNNCGSQHKISLQVDKNQTYYIKWFNNGGAYTWNLSESDAAPGEFCITALPAKQDTNISEHQNSNPLWFYYTPTRDCEINVSTCGLTTQQLSLYITTGCGTFDEVPRKITDCGDFQYTYSFQGIKGQKLYLLWSGYTITQPYKWVLTEANAEPGELCSSALTAVSDTNISDHTANYERWYVYTAKVNGTMRISNCGLTVYNTRLDVFTECGSTTPVATGLSSCFQQSEVNIPCKYGHKYYIRWQCADNSSFPWVIQETSDGTEVATIETPVFSVYPNPATQKIFISWKGQQPGAATLEMYNMQGQRVCTQKLFSQLSLVDIASLPSGIYMVVLKHDAGTYRTKVVVK